MAPARIATVTRPYVLAFHRLLRPLLRGRWATALYGLRISRQGEPKAGAGEDANRSATGGPPGFEGAALGRFTPLVRSLGITFNPTS
ncbi:MAG: hypothetical protein J07HX5_00081 [halophilic archaeon J07HX5]|nr:MAG: hypothetical protein J07HX5_00081 [halophilic archaeon J07HX5]